MKLHVLSLPEPQPITGDVLTDCGAIVQQATVACMFDSQAMGLKLELPGNVCCKCLKEAKSARYVYGVVNGNELEEERRVL